MKKVLLIAAMIISFVCCAERAYAQHGEWGREWYASFSGGIVSVKDSKISPMGSLRFGADFGRFFGDIEASYISVKSNDWEYNEIQNLSTVTIGVNAYVKFVAGKEGHLALGFSTGGALQEDFHREPFGGPHGPRPYRGKGYVGFSLQGQINLSQIVSLFAEARYQSLPVEGAGRTQWGIVAHAGLKFYF